MKLAIKDETLGGELKKSFTIENLTEETSVREVIRARVYQEVRDHNQAQKDRSHFTGLIAPSPLEKTLNTRKPKTNTPIDWKEQVEKAYEAFSRNGFFIMINDQQVESLDHIFKITVDTEVSFIKLVPLVGG